LESKLTQTTQLFQTELAQAQKALQYEQDELDRREDALAKTNSKIQVQQGVHKDECQQLNDRYGAELVAQAEATARAIAQLQTMTADRDKFKSALSQRSATLGMPHGLLDDDEEIVPQKVAAQPRRRGIQFEDGTKSASLAKIPKRQRNMSTENVPSAEEAAKKRSEGVRSMLRTQSMPAGNQEVADHHVAIEQREQFDNLHTWLRARRNSYAALGEGAIADDDLKELKSHEMPDSESESEEEEFDRFDSGGFTAARKSFDLGTKNADGTPRRGRIDPDDIKNFDPDEGLSLINEIQKQMASMRADTSSDED